MKASDRQPQPGICFSLQWHLLRSTSGYFFLCSFCKVLINLFFFDQVCSCLRCDLPACPPHIVTRESGKICLMVRILVLPIYHHLHPQLLGLLKYLSCCIPFRSLRCAFVQGLFDYVVRSLLTEVFSERGGLQCEVVAYTECKILAVVSPSSHLQWSLHGSRNPAAPGPSFSFPPWLLCTSRPPFPSQQGT